MVIKQMHSQHMPKHSQQIVSRQLVHSAVSRSTVNTPAEPFLPPPLPCPLAISSDLLCPDEYDSGSVVKSSERTTQLNTSAHVCTDSHPQATGLLDAQPPHAPDKTTANGPQTTTTWHY